MEGLERGRFQHSGLQRDVRSSGPAGIWIARRPGPWPQMGGILPVSFELQLVLPRGASA